MFHGVCCQFTAWNLRGFRSWSCFPPDLGVPVHLAADLDSVLHAPGDADEVRKKSPKIGQMERKHPGRWEENLGKQMWRWLEIIGDDWRCLEMTSKERATSSEYIKEKVFMIWEFMWHQLSSATSLPFQSPASEGASTFVRKFIFSYSQMFAGSV